MSKTHSYPKKVVDKKTLMKCMNSEPEFSKYRQAVPEEGVCNEWVVVDENTVMTLCSKCVQRLVSASPISKIYED